MIGSLSAGIMFPIIHCASWSVLSQYLQSEFQGWER